MSIGAWKAFVQLFTKPNFWEKTDHGFCAYEDKGRPLPAVAAPVPPMAVGPDPATPAALA
jgi:hypothetical protein